MYNCISFSILQAYALIIQVKVMRDVCIVLNLPSHSHTPHSKFLAAPVPKSP